MSEEKRKKEFVPDLDFLRYADDVRESKSLKRFIDSGKEKRERYRKGVKERVLVETTWFISPLM